MTPEASALQQAETGAETQVGPRRDGLTTRALIVGAVFGAIGAIWSLQSDSVLATCRVGEAVPPIPAIAAVLVLVGLNLLLGRVLGRRLFSQADIGVSFTFAAIGAMFTSYGVLMYFYSFVIAYPYFATPENHLADYLHLVPRWYMPQSAEAVRQFYEGGEAIPWRDWLVPQAAWLVFFIGLFGGALCIARLFHNEWSHRERLTYPIAQFITSLADVESGGVAGHSLLRNPITWIGVGIAGVYNALNFAHSFNPAVPAIPSWFPLTQFFVEHPWTGFVRTGGYGYAIKTSPTITGIAFFVPLEQAISVIFFFHCMRLLNVGLVSAGYDNPGSPFQFQQAAGAYVAVALFLAWSARHSIAASARALWDRLAQTAPDTPPAWALVGSVVCTAIVAGWLIVSGMAPWVTATYLLMYIGFALTYARARAEAGVPVLWVYPNYQHREMILAVFGSRGLLNGGGPSNVVILWFYGFLSRGYLQSTQALFNDSLRIGDDTRAHRLAQPVACGLGILLALVLGSYIVMRACYTHGYNSMSGTPLSEGTLAANSVAAAIEQPTGPVLAKAFGGLTGVLISLGLIFARRAWLRFPLHPLGYAMAMAYGEILWFPFLLSGTIKWVVLRMGGVGAYRRAQAGFMGLVLGHGFFGGVLLSLLQMWNSELFRRYMVDFG